MKKSKRNWNLLVILGYLVLGTIWLAYGTNINRAFDIALGACFLGLSLGRTYILVRDLKDVRDLSDYTDASFQINMHFGADTKDD